MTQIIPGEARPLTLARRGTSVSDWWLGLRNRILSSPRFQRWAARFPLTRLIARRRASSLFDLCAGFVYSQVLNATVRLRLLEELTAGPQTAAELAPVLALGPDAARRLLDAAASLRLVERRGGGRYGLGVHGASLIANPAVARMIEHHALLYRDLADPVALLRGEQASTELGQFWSYAGHSAAVPSTDAQVAQYSALMAGSLSLIAQDILEAYPLGRHRCLLDVGGGEGAFVEAAARKAPELLLWLFDLPPVAARACARLGRAGLAGKTTVIGGDVFRDALPQGADLVSLVRVLHDHEDAQALRILQAVRRALPPGGVLLVAEPMAGTAGAEPMGDAYFGFYLLAMGQGRPRTSAQLRALLQEAGFARVRSSKTRRPMLTRLMVAEVT
ncbi:MAG TPA: methyltransferase [Pseudomonadota bacterium]|nr:methyltransferase [Pseudomonadota bacterium]